MDKKFEVTGEVSIVSTGKKEVFKEDFEKVVDSIGTPVVEAGLSLSDIYDRYSKLWYVVDASGSMGEGMLSEDYLKRFKWTPELLLQFRKAMKKDLYFEKIMAAQKAEDDAEDEAIDEFDEDDFPAAEEEAIDPLDAVAYPDDALKMEILRNHLDSKYHIDLEINYNVRLKSRSKMMALKDAAKSFVHTRFEKIKDARVGLFQFEEQPSLMVSAGASEQEVMAAINRLPDNGGGGTNIYRAVDRVVNECKKRSSEIGMHHVVLISDGCDYGAVEVESLVQKMKDIGIVFDFIYMIGAEEDSQGKTTAEVMKRVCEFTGGEYTTVKTEQDFEQKFLTVSSRPMLPPARS